jgi:aspartate/methionine/tyrosine aminotransferase
MNIPNIKLFQWLEKNSSKAKHVLAYSNIPGLTYDEYQTLTDYSLSPNFNLNQNKDTGAQELKELLSSSYSCQPEQVVTSTGGSEANFLIYLALLQHGDEVIVEKPGYEPLFSTSKIFGTRNIYWARNFEHDFQLDIESLQNLITKKTKLIVLTNLHNPSGVLIPQKSIQSVAELAEEYNIYVFIDEIFLDGAFHSQCSSFGLPHVIITSSMTKIYGVGGLRTGWIIAPKEVAIKCQNAKSHTTGCSPYISEILSSYLLRNAKDLLINRYQLLSKKNIAIVKKWVKQNNHLLNWVEPHGGVVCFPKYHSDISSEDLCLRLFNTYSILITPGQYFNQDGHFRLSFGCNSEELKAGLNSLEKGLEFILGSQ